MEREIFIDTRGYLNHLLDYSSVFDSSKKNDDAINLLKGIPSVAILLHIASVNLELYLNDSGEQGQKTQNKIIKSLLRFDSPFVQRIIKTYSETVQNNQWPIIFYRYSNLLFYDMILSNYNTLPIRELLPVEMEKVIEAYLIINSEVNKRVKINDAEFENALMSDQVEKVVLPQFLYQKDFTSNTDYTNQVTRCFYFLKYLEENNKFKPYLTKYYSKIGVINSADFITKLVGIFSGVMRGNAGQKTPIIRVIDGIYEPHNSLLLQMTVDPTNTNYRQDENFTFMRNRMFLLTPTKKFLLLDINFLIDYFYKAQIFNLNQFFKSYGIKNFLSIKAEHFTEKIYLKMVMERCFPNATILPGSDLIKNDKNPLSDFCIFKGGEILLIEFKDTLLSAVAKNSANEEIVFRALDTKFLRNEVNDPKGIQQIFNAITYLATNPTDIERLFRDKNPTIFPVIIFTDNTFGYDGVNKVFKQKFRNLFEGSDCFLKIEEVTFINLNFFEIQENYLREDKMDIFNLIKLYHNHTAHSNFSATPFEVFATQYKKTYVPVDLGLPLFYLETCEKVKHELLAE